MFLCLYIVDTLLLFLPTSTYELVRNIRYIHSNARVTLRIGDRGLLIEDQNSINQIVFNFNPFRSNCLNSNHQFAILQSSQCDTSVRISSKCDTSMCDERKGIYCPCNSRVSALAYAPQCVKLRVPLNGSSRMLRRVSIVRQREADRISVTCFELSGQFPTSFNLLVEQKSSDQNNQVRQRQKEYTSL